MKIAIRFVLFLSLLASIGCARSTPEVFVPIQETAELQYAYAVNYRSKHDLALRDMKEMERLLRTREAVRQTFGKVIEYFPEDKSVTPLAKLELADMVAKMDQPKLKPSKRELKRAIKEFQHLREEYPDFEYIQAKAAYDEALCWKALGDFEQAQKLFKDVADHYEHNKDRFIRGLSGMARYHYQQTYIN